MGFDVAVLVSVEVMAFKHLQSLLSCTKYLRSKQNKATHLRLVLYNSCSEDSHEEEPLPFEWYEKPFHKVLKLTHLLKDVDLIDGRLVNISDNSVVVDD